MNLLDTTIHEIERDLDITHQRAADAFIVAAKLHHQPFVLSRHVLYVKTYPGPGLVVKAGNLANPWWELGRPPHKPGSVLQAIAEIGCALDDLPEAIQRKLDGVQL